MFLAEKMDRLSVVVVKKDMEAVLTEITRLGALHPARLNDFGAWAAGMPDAAPDQLIADYAKREQRVRQFLATLPATTHEIGLDDTLPPVSIGDIDRIVEAADNRLRSSLEACAALRARRDTAKSLREQFAMLGISNAEFPSLLRSTLLHTAIGNVPTANLGNLEREIAPLSGLVIVLQSTPPASKIICVALRRDKVAMDGLLHKFEFAPTPFNRDTVPNDEESDNELEAQLAQATDKLLIEQNAVRPALAEVSYRIDCALLLLRARTWCKDTERTQVISGWVPKEQTKQTVAALEKQFGTGILINSVPASTIPAARSGAIEIPVLFRRSPMLRPFAMLLDGFGVPTYYMLDPAPFAALAFLLMFGMMFGDIGHGLVLVIAGFATIRKLAAWRNAGILALYCGVSSVVFGVLYGSVFGVEDLIPALWLSPLHDMNTLFAAAIGFGIVLISVGLILHAINAVRSREFLQSLFDEHGLLAALAYWLGIALALIYFLAPGEISFALLALVASPLAALFAKGPVLVALGKQEKACPDGIISYIMESAITVLDIVTSFLANTVSFIRVAAFGIAHAALFVAIFSISDAVSGGVVGGFASGLVIVVGNAIVIVLEGMVVTIQAVRLNYYEFFGKFFTRQGLNYQPICFPVASTKAE